jgi:beta-glucanase (GH16 family)
MERTPLSVDRSHRRARARGTHAMTVMIWLINQPHRASEDAQRSRRSHTRRIGSAGSGTHDISNHLIGESAMQVARGLPSIRYPWLAKSDRRKVARGIPPTVQTWPRLRRLAAGLASLLIVRQVQPRRCVLAASPHSFYLVMGLALGLLLFTPATILALLTTPQGYRLTFSDEFTGISLDPDCSGNATWATYWCNYNVRNLAGNDDQALKADPSFRGTGGPTLADHGLLTHELMPGNTLKLYGRVIPRSIRPQYYDFPYVAGMISTERSHAQTYGYWEARARLTNTSKGHHWAMWLVPEDGSWPPEIDMVEVTGKDPKTFYLNAHGTGKDELVWFSPDNPSGWHTFGFLWTQSDLVWYVDGVERKRIDNYINKPMYWLISPEIGNSWAGPTDNSTVWPMEAEVDYVRVYKLDAASNDVTAPSVPTDLTSEVISSSQVDLSRGPLLRTMLGSPGIRYIAAPRCAAPLRIRCFSENPGLGSAFR